MGYHRAGFDVVGVDIVDQPNFPGSGLFPRDGFEFHRADALEYPLNGFDAIHASPPCQAFTTMRHLGKMAGMGAVDLIGLMRERLQSAGKPYIIENVVGSPLINPVRLCGSSFGLGVRRHRLFETNFLTSAPACNHEDVGRPIAVYGDHPQGEKEKSYRINRATSLEEGQAAMGIDWMEWRPLTQAIPPAYTEWIGRQLLGQIENEKNPASIPAPN